jgi:hypothetical protein
MVEYDEWSVGRCDGTCQRQEGSLPTELEVMVQKFLENKNGKLWGVYYYPDGMVEVV